MKKISFVLLLLSFAISIKGQVNTKDSIFPNSILVFITIEQPKLIRNIRV